MWVPGMDESAESQRARARSALSEFGDINSTFISVTAHAGIIRYFLEVLGHPNSKFPMHNSYILPVLYRNSVGPKLHQEFIQSKPRAKCDVCTPKTVLATVSKC
jgi:hypothetical protein